MANQANQQEQAARPEGAAGTASGNATDNITGPATGNAAAAVHHLLPDSLFVAVWGALVVLTAITSGASVWFPGTVGHTVALIVTPLKAALVLTFFMHLKYESVGFRAMLFATLGIVVVFLGLTYMDYLYR